MALAALVVVIGTLFAGVVPAQAHAVLEKTSPAKNAVLTTAPTEVVLTFDEPPQNVGDLVQVTGPAGVVSQGSPTLTGPSIHQALNTRLPNGSYRVTWRAVSDDGHPVSGTFAFTLNQSSGGAATATAGAAPSGSSTSTATSAAMPAKAAAQDAGRGWLVWVAVAIAVLALIALAARRLTRHDTEAP